jgi:hypothetical protein
MIVAPLSGRSPAGRATSNVSFLDQPLDEGVPVARRDRQKPVDT